jgi:hypothetical protein
MEPMASLRVRSQVKTGRSADRPAKLEDEMPAIIPI